MVDMYASKPGKTRAGLQFTSYSDRRTPSSVPHTVTPPPRISGPQAQPQARPRQPVSPRTAGYKAPTAPIGANGADMSVMAQAARMHDGVKAQYGATDRSAQAQLSRMAPPPASEQPEPAYAPQQLAPSAHPQPAAAVPQYVQPPAAPQNQRENEALARLMNQTYQQGNNTNPAFNQAISTDLAGAQDEIRAMYYGN